MIKETKNFLKYMLIKNNIGNFCFFVDKNNFNYYKLREANIKFKNQDLNFINSYLLKYNDSKIGKKKFNLKRNKPFVIAEWTQS